MSIPARFDIIVHYIDNNEGPPVALENVDPNMYCYFDLMSSVINMAPYNWNDRFGCSFKLDYMVNMTGERKDILGDKDILAMFEVNKRFKFIRVYATAEVLKAVNISIPDDHEHCHSTNTRHIDKGKTKNIDVENEGNVSVTNEVVAANINVVDGNDSSVGQHSMGMEVVITESDNEYIVEVVNSTEGSDNNSGSEFVVDEDELQGWDSSDGLSGCEDKFDQPGDIHSDEDRYEVYVDRGMAGKRFEYDTDGKVTLETGMIFTDVHHFREVLRDYVIQEGFEIFRLKNEKARVTAICDAECCSWRIHASPTPDGVTYKIKTYNPIHTCIRQTKNKHANAVWIAKKLESKLREDPNMSYAGMKAELMERWGIEPNTLMQLYRARRRVKEDSRGMHAQSYNKLPAWAQLAMETNPRSIVKLELEPRLQKNPEFKRFFVCFDAMKKGFVRGCRPWFGIDGCHLKGPFGGVLLSAVAIDGNKGMFPIAFAVAEIECISSWKFFFHHLREALESVPEWSVDSPLTIMSDMQKGLKGAIAEFFPYAKHRYCCNHLLSNLKVRFKTMVLTDMFWAVAMAHNEFLFSKGMERLRKHNSAAADWLMSEERPKSMWARHTIESVFKSDHVTNNVAESFNSWVGDDRRKTILSMVESLTTRLMGRFAKRYEKGCGFDYQVTPRIRKIMDSIMQDGRYCKVTYAGNDEFQIKDGFTMFVVNLIVRTCGCNVWVLSGLPCKHACACIAYKREDVERYCDSFYSNAMYCKAYGEIIHPMPEVPKTYTGGYEVTIDPPKLKRLQGRPRRNRKRAAHEDRSSNNEARRSSTVRCGNCKEFGHNSRACQRAPVASKGKNRKAKTGEAQGGNVAQGGNEAQRGNVAQGENGAQGGNVPQGENEAQGENVPQAVNECGIGSNAGARRKLKVRRRGTGTELAPATSNQGIWAGAETFFFPEC